MRLRWVLLLALLTARPAGAATPLPVETATVYVTTLPSGADVWIDGTYVGHSPKLIGALPLGHHVVTVAKAGWEGGDHPLELVDPSRPVLESIALDPGDTSLGGSGRLALHAEALPPEIVVDGSPVRLVGGGCALAAGTHTVVLYTARGRITRRVTIYAEMTTDVVVRDESDPDEPK